MPLVGIQFAGGKGLEAGAGRNGNVGDYQAGMVGGHVVVESIGEDSVVAIEEEDDDCGDECNGAQLRERANLIAAACQYSSLKSPAQAERASSIQYAASS